MSRIGQPERATQQRVIDLFVKELGYRFIGNRADRTDNSSVDEELLEEFLRRQKKYSESQINAALYKLKTEANNSGRSLYINNQEVYKLLRYGVPVKVEAGQQTENVQLIDWNKPERNDFAIAEEVTLKGGHERRPDLVLYINGIAIGVIELKNSRTGIGEGIRQLLSNQQPEFNAWFFSTVQIVFAGSDSEGLKFGTILTPEKYFLTWKEDEQDNSRLKLDKYLLNIGEKRRLLELIHDFVLFDSGVKKLPRPHQYFGVKAAQQHVRRKQGGIIWHTQGSGKSIVMVMLAKWILENNPKARVAIITDRDELDKQIKDVFQNVGVTIQRSTSGRDLLQQLASPSPRLLCSLVHKFRRADAAGIESDKEFEEYIRGLQKQASPTVGEIFVFVDECHRTQSGRLHKLMKTLMSNAVFIGFTGTPLLKDDKQTSLEVFGSYIHTYKFCEAVEDGVVLDLVYEARDINTKLGSQEKIDQWFEAKTKGLNKWQKDKLMREWGTMQTVLSSKSRMERLIADIIFDFSVRPRLSSHQGNAMLVASSIYEACKYFELLQRTPLKGKCAIITSYNPQAKDVSKEETGANTETDKQFIYNTYIELLEGVAAKPGMTKTESYEEDAKDLFVEQPGEMRLLVVVDKLLTGFDAPPCTYLYIDKPMQDHGLFQAICRTNRLDGPTKDFGYIVDYKGLFKKVENAISVYTSELDNSSGGPPPDVLVQERLRKGKERLDDAIESLVLLCEPVEPPKEELQHIHYFCGNTEIPTDLAAREPQRTALYMGTVALLRAYANIGDQLSEAGYDDAGIERVRKQVDHFTKLRDVIRNAAGESLDLKAYEADMRHLIDTYIEADQSKTTARFENLGLLELIVKTGIADAIAARLSALRGNKDAIAETIENNVRKTITREQMSDPVFYERMSKLLDEIIAKRKQEAIAYEEYLKKIEKLAKELDEGPVGPIELKTPAQRAIYNLLSHAATDELEDAVVEPSGTYSGKEGLAIGLALELDRVMREKAPAGFRDKQEKERVVKYELFQLLKSEELVERVFPVIKAQREY